jgi:UDP-glucose 4-epimerase
VLSGKPLLFASGTGTFGKAVFDHRLKKIRIFSRDEKKQEDLRLAFNNPKLKFFLGDVRSYDSVGDGISLLQKMQT